MATGTLFYPPQSTPLSSNGSPQAGMYACFFATGTLTPASVYANGNLTTPLSQPTPGSVNPSGGTVANGSGVLPVIFLNPSTAYRVQLYTASGILISDTDPWFISGAANTAFSSGSAAAPGIAFAAASGTGLYVPSTNSLGFATAGIAAGAISASQAWSLPAASGANTFTAQGPQSFYAGVFNGNGTASDSFGLQVLAGSNTSDIAMLVGPQAGGTYFEVLGNGETYVTEPPASTGVSGCHQVGYLDAPQRSFAVNTSVGLSDRGKLLYTATSGLTLTIPANASVALPVGTQVVVVNLSAGSLTIAITSDTLAWLPSDTLGTRTLANAGQCTLLKVTPTIWTIVGVGLS